MGAQTMLVIIIVLSAGDGDPKMCELIVATKGLSEGSSSEYCFVLWLYFYLLKIFDCALFKQFCSELIIF